MAAILDVPVDDFVRLWFADAAGLATSVFPSYQDYIIHVCQQLEVQVSDDQINTAATFPRNVTKQMLMTPRNGAIDVLTYLKTNGYKTGLISDCAADVPEIWNDTLYAPLIDVAVFSCSAGMNKTDLRIFRMATDQLAVKPENCLYIADGMRQELANASKLGMHAVQILVPEETDDNPMREEWDGPAITSLREIFTLL